MNIGVDNNLLGVIGEDHVGKLVTMLEGRANPMPKCFRVAIRLLIEDFLPEVVGQVG